ncbi:TIGR04133 family radical SAM/SPASM protein [Saccharicrinis fermentans]|uniref:Molybdenum cofactor biosynthesis protein A n=1 Tax=Saccharicrinis fermentans DSM 9555 = JCM 21142 TaxID=869213 RepID=W7YKR2_9BACT|nr:TIGR04133 family radical SAM/SPASM protein [Saccharicrinis fermentans]GAF02949.1 molybdenum cofactor biosynthesis protein A [Saccharicrinis fermentans DSM 9555 = JCM 21142]
MFNALKNLTFSVYKKVETSLHELNYLFWECTTRCNLNCLHCGSDCSKNSQFQDMPLTDLLSALDTIDKPASKLLVVITGGEPLVRKDLEECGMAIRKKGFRWSIVSNGYLYTKERHVSLLNAGMGALTMSLDGLNNTHNWLRNNHKSFERVSNAIDLAQSATRLNFDIVTCVHKRNLNELPELMKFLISKGVKSWRLFTIIPIGRAVHNQELHLSNNEFVQLMEFIKSARRENALDVKFSCEGYVGKYENSVRDTPFFCRAGINIGSVLIDGSISACPNIDRSFTQGNIYKDNFSEVWENKFHKFRNRNWTKAGQCKNCKDYNKCQGNGLHNWHGDKENVLVCHNMKQIRGTDSCIGK